MITENVSTLKIHKLTQAQYDRELAAGNIDEFALYLTPDNGASGVIPTITEDDENKVLMVVDGELQFVLLNLTVDENGTLIGGATGGGSVTDEYINSLIDAKLGVIENGTY